MARTANKDTNRSDAEIFAEARNTLDCHPGVPATVHVHVSDRVVTLTGSARSSSERAEAEDALEQIPGVRRVVNNITVAMPHPEGFELPAERG